MGLIIDVVLWFFRVDLVFFFFLDIFFFLLTTVLKQAKSLTLIIFEWNEEGKKTRLLIGKKGNTMNE